MSIPMIDEPALAHAKALRRQPRGPIVSEVRREQRGRRWSLHRHTH